MTPDSQGPAKRKRRKGPLKDRIIRITRNESLGECHEWNGPLFRSNGYGMSNLNGKLMAVHRVVWIEANGPIPDGMVVMHRCDNQLCIRLDHLAIGTNKQNSADCAAKGRNRRKKITPEQVEYIRSSTKSPLELSKELNRDPSSIRRVIRKITHKKKGK